MIPVQRRVSSESLLVSQTAWPELDEAINLNKCIRTGVLELRKNLI
jgi:hypothetical protein